MLKKGSSNHLPRLEFCQLIFVIILRSGIETVRDGSTIERPFDVANFEPDNRTYLMEFDANE